MARFGQPAGCRVIRLALAALMAVAAGGPPVRAADCPVPDRSFGGGNGLPSVAAAVRSRDLRILALGGAATLGAAAQGTAFTYPARLGVYLRQALPGVTVAIDVITVPREPSAGLVLKVATDLAHLKPALVVWGPGGGAAGRGDDLDSFNALLGEVSDKVRASGADLIMMTLQYAPSVARVVNLDLYRSAVLRVAESKGAPVLDRYEMMRYWNEIGFVNLDATDPAERILVARALYDCVAETLAKGIAARGIADAVR